MTKHEVTAHKTKLRLLALIASGAALTAGALVTAIDLQQPTSTEVTNSEMTMGCHQHPTDPADDSGDNVR